MVIFRDSDSLSTCYERSRFSCQITAQKEHAFLTLATLYSNRRSFAGVFAPLWASMSINLDMGIRDKQL
jgi:hypothetical protein